MLQIKIIGRLAWKPCRFFSARSRNTIFAIRNVGMQIDKKKILNFIKKKILHFVWCVFEDQNLNFMKP